MMLKAHELMLGALLMLVLPVLSHADDDDNAAPLAAGADMTLTAAQRQSLGIVIGRAAPARMPGQIKAYGLVLDPSVLVEDAAQARAAEVQQQAAQSELARLKTLYGNGAGGSLKLIETAEAEQAKAIAQGQVARARLRQHWGGLEKLQGTDRQKVLAAVGVGNAALMRADLIGQHTLAVLPNAAQVDVDGLQVAARVLGFLQQTDETQSVSVLLYLERAPPGLGTGARIPVALSAPADAGMLLPRSAILYDEQGAYVFEQHLDKSQPATTHYARHNIKLLVSRGDSWLVSGVDDDDAIVVGGAGALWSLAANKDAQPDDDD